MNISIKQQLVSRIFLSAVLVWFAVTTVSTARAQYTNMHDFAGGNVEGRIPYGSLSFSGSTLYGMTLFGGNSDLGVIFKMNIDGGNYTNLHEFVGGNNDGKDPWDSLTLSGSTLYGMTHFGGNSDLGVIFKMDIDGGNYTNLHKFVGGNNDGQKPYGSLTLSSNSLYGMTGTGGNDNRGVIFKIDTDGSNYTNLHKFGGEPDDGRGPQGSLTLSGSTLYGMTLYGGSNNCGVIFKIDTDGSNYTVLHKFVGGNNDGRNTLGNLTLSGSTLYGMTMYGGNSDEGVIFKMETDGSGYTNLHEFSGGSNDGNWPYGSLTLYGSILCGMAYYGGNDNFGVIFKIDTDGNNYTLLHEFAGGSDDGKYPRGDLTLSGNTLYGMTRRGGDSNYGVVFKQLIPEPSGIWIIGILEYWIIVKRRKRVPGVCLGLMSSVK